MATIFELAQMSSDVYEGTPSGTPPTGPLLQGLNTSQWKVLTTSNAASPSFWWQGYFGVAYYNTVTQELVIANRGTDPDNGPATFFKNLFSDLRLANENKVPQVETDATEFADYVLQNLSALGVSTISSLIETGHSLGGAEAQIAQAHIVDLDGQYVESDKVSGVGFNAPGIGAYFIQSPASTYNFTNIVTWGDAIHEAGGTHLGTSTVTLAAGPDTSQLLPTSPGGLSDIPSDNLPPYGSILYQTLYKAHIISTILNWIGIGDQDSETGTFNWTSSSDGSEIPGGISVNGSLPSYSVDSYGNLVVTDPSSGIVATLSPSPDGQSLVATFGGGGSAFAQALSSLGAITVPFGELGESLGGLQGAATINETISRNASGTLDVSFLGGGSAAQFTATVSDPLDEFDYALPGSGQTLIETIDNGADSPSGSISVLAGTTTTQLTGGSAVGGQTVTWTDGSHDQYQFIPEAAGSGVGTLVISQGLFGSSGDEIVINDFNLTTAQNSSNGYLGIELPEELTLSAGTKNDPNAPAIFPGGSEQSYTLSLDAPSDSAQTVTVSLGGASSSDFEVDLGGNDTIAINSNQTFQVTLAGGQTNLTFGLSDTTPDDGTSDIANGGALQLTASVQNPLNPTGNPLTSNQLNITYVAQAPVTGQAPNATDVITGQYDTTTGATNYYGDGGNDYFGAATANDYIQGTNSVNDSIIGGSGNNTIYGGTGNDVITLNGTNDYVELGTGFSTVNGSANGKDTIIASGGTDIIAGNGGTDVIDTDDGNAEVYAGSPETLSEAIATASSGTATQAQGDFIAVRDGDNTVVGGDGDDLITTGGNDYGSTPVGNDFIVLGPGDDTVLGGYDAYFASADWSASLNSDNQLTVNNIYSNPDDYIPPYLQPYNVVVCDGCRSTADLTLAR